jgi:hypothetical protein
MWHLPKRSEREMLFLGTRPRRAIGLDPQFGDLLLQVQLSLHVRVLELFDVLFVLPHLLLHRSYDVLIEQMRKKNLKMQIVWSSLTPVGPAR